MKSCQSAETGRYSVTEAIWNGEFSAAIWQWDDQSTLVSLPGEIVWAQARNLNASHSFTEFFGSMSLGGGDPPYWDLMCGIPINWRWNLIGFRYGDGRDAEGDNTCSVITVPYWLVVIPLTLISAFLLHSNP